MSITSVAPCFLLMGTFLAYGTLVAKSSPYYRTLIESSKKSRYECIDGLRGFLALGVFFLHGLITYYYQITGTWDIPPSAFYTVLAELSVALFFMISGFLFWGKMLKTKKPINALRLYRSRWQRLAPMYVFSVVLVLLIVAIRTDFELQVEPWSLLFQVVSWFSFGFLGIPTLPDVNGLQDTHTIQSVIWTLTFEWEFYLLLPLFSRLPARTSLLIAACGITYFLGPPIIVAMNFAFGAVAACLMHRFDFRERFKGRQFDLVMMAALILIFALFQRGHGVPQYVLGFVFFFLTVNGNNLFGLLTSASAKILGLTSYSIYLLHSIILNQVFYSYSLAQSVTLMTSQTFWFLVALSGLLTISVSLVTYRFVELRYYNIGA